MVTAHKLRKMTIATDKFEAKRDRVLEKTQNPFITAGIFIVGFLIFTILFINGLNAFYKHYELYIRSPFQNPIVLQKKDVGTVEKFHSPIPEEPVKKVTPTPIKKRAMIKKDIILASKYPKFIDHIWYRESGRGTNDNPNGLHNICNSKGMTNDFGFAVRVGHCWNTFEEAVNRMVVWREKEAKGLTDNQALCYYNTGKASDTCPYLTEDFLSMN